MNINIVGNGVVAHRPGQMYGWPGITRAANGDILVSASERKFHICPFGREVFMRSTDNGKTWGLPQEIFNSELDDRDANITTLKDGTIVQSWFTSIAFEAEWPERSARVTDKIRQEVAGTWMLRSFDHGYTWEDTALKMPVGMHISPVELSDSSLISIGFEDRFDLKEDYILKVYKSHDKGESWNYLTDIDCEYNILENGAKRAILNENHVIETEPGKLVALFRRCGDCLYQASSNDYGVTWTSTKKTEIQGYPVHMLKLSNGAVMAAYGYRWDPYSIRAVFSYDDCRSWDIENTVTLYQWEDQLDMGYPVSIEMEPGRIMTVFYCNRRYKSHKNSDIDNKEKSPEGILYIISEYRN